MGFRSKRQTILFAGGLTSMDQKETISLYKLGKKKWNKWANDLLARREELEKSGEWEDICYADFEDYIFEKDANFSGFIFPDFAAYTSAVFKEKAFFSRAIFHGSAFFDKTTFQRDTRFFDAQFKSFATFSNATFENEITFSSSNFKVASLFESTTFTKIARFFHVKFDSPSSFRKATFLQDSDFETIYADSLFSLEQVSFSQPPDFRQAHFREAPDLDRITIHAPPFVDPDIAAQYRALKKLAIQGHDHEQELNFFAGELEAKGTFFGYLYGLFSNYGCSVQLPLLAWLVTTLYAAMGYHAFSIFGRFKESSASAVENCPNLSSAFELSARKALLAFGWEKSVRLDQIYACLYGTQNGYNGKLMPHIPSWVSLGTLAQGVLSAIFIFLTLLAVRNRFRIK